MSIQHHSTLNTQHSTSLIDSHCHLNHPDFFGDLAEVLHRAQEAGVCKVICAGFELESSTLAVRLSREIKMVCATVGVHPHDSSTFTLETEDQIRKLAADKEHVVAIGETGLDYHYNLSPKEDQQKAYRRHIIMAHEMELPLVIHARDAYDDVLYILKEEGLPPRGVVMHCMPSNRDFAMRSLELGCYVGIAGPITFRNAGDLREIAKELPLDRILLETDAPYLTPHPHRGQRNEPSYLPLTAASLAEAKGATPNEIASAATSNARKLFGLMD